MSLVVLLMSRSARLAASWWKVFFVQALRRFPSARASAASTRTGMASATAAAGASVRRRSRLVFIRGDFVYGSAWNYAYRREHSSPFGCAVPRVPRISPILQTSSSPGDAHKKAPVDPGREKLRARRDWNRRSTFLHLMRSDVGVARIGRNAHPVEAAINEHEADDEDRSTEDVLERVRHFHRDLDGEKSEERREFDHRIERH